MRFSPGICLLIMLALASSNCVYAQSPLAASARTAVPALVPYSGVVESHDAKTSQVGVTFLIFKDEQGGEPLFTESQTIALDGTGRYQAQLGATRPSGLPADLFSTGEARWLEIQVAGEKPRPRVLLASVPYALKAADSATLGGLPASAFALAGSTSVLAEPARGAQTIAPDATSTVTTTGGTTDYLAKFSGTSSIVKSLVFDTGTNVGIGTTSPTATLTITGTLAVNGASTLNGSLSMNPLATATSSKSNDSQQLKIYASAYNSSTKAAVSPHFIWQAEPTGNNTSSPGATLNLLAAASTSASETGFYFNTNGTMHFASAQTFPTGTGSGGSGTITGVTASSPLTGGGTSGAVTVGLNTSALETTLNATYPTLAASNHFTSGSTFAGQLTGNSASSAYAIQGNTNTGIGLQGRALSTNGRAVEGDASGNGGIGVYANATGGANGSTYPIGVYAHVGTGTGIMSVLDTANIGQTAILGQTGGPSAQYATFLTDGLVAGVWGDTANSSTEVPMAVAGTADNGYAGVFENTSTTWSTLYVYNKGGGSTGVDMVSANAEGLSTTGHFDTLMAGNRHGTCGIGGGGDLSCTGQIKSLVATRAGARTLETYSVQSPENWMEDFGSGSLTSGSVIVRIDPDFAETVSNSADYRIFLTPNGDSKGLYVTNKTPTSFEVRESGGGTASISFDYRIVAKRRGLEAQRLTDVTEKFNTEMKAASKHLHPARLDR